MKSIVQMGERISSIVRRMKNVQDYNPVPYVGKTKIVDFGDTDVGKGSPKKSRVVRSHKRGETQFPLSSQFV